MKRMLRQVLGLLAIWAKELGIRGVTITITISATGAFVIAAALVNPAQEASDHLIAPAGREVGLLSPIVKECPVDAVQLPSPTGVAQEFSGGKRISIICDHPDTTLTQFVDGSWQGLDKHTGKVSEGDTASEVMQ